MAFQLTTSRNEADAIAGDRRADRRYPISLELRYKLIRRRRVLDAGVGRTLDLSSGGILFEADRPLPIGLNVELSIEWPVLLHNVAPMRLLVSGRIVRGEHNRIALRSVQHEFRTQGSGPLAIDAARQTKQADRSISGPVLATPDAYAFWSKLQ